MERLPKARKALPRRHYRDDVQLSILGFGGMVVVGQDPKSAGRIVAEAVERGVNYFDVAPTYGDGESEIKLGYALLPHRQDVFLACKTTARDAAGAQKELDRSLERLHTERFDLYQFHAVTSLRDVEQILGPHGAAETFLKARAQGKARYLGCSAHSSEAALALMDGFKLDSILFPVNYILYQEGGFGPQILAYARENGVGTLGAQVPCLHEVGRRRAEELREVLVSANRRDRLSPSGVALYAFRRCHRRHSARRRTPLSNGPRSGI
jgi:aryl-alcohol dehydrogenase-like predicted oxidoreductase